MLLRSNVPRFIVFALSCPRPPHRHQMYLSTTLASVIIKSWFFEKFHRVLFDEHWNLSLDCDNIPTNPLLTSTRGCGSGSYKPQNLDGAAPYVGVRNFFWGDELPIPTRYKTPPPHTWNLWPGGGTSPPTPACGPHWGDWMLSKNSSF